MGRRISYRLEIYKKELGTYPGEFKYSSTATVIDDAIALSYDKSIEANTDKCNFRLRNVKDQTGNYVHREDVKVDDRILLYISTTEITSANKSSYLRFDGVVTETNYEVSSSGRMLVINGQSRLKSVLNFTWAAAYEPTATFDSTASDIVQALLGHVNDDNLNYQITWASGNDVTTTPIQYYSNYRSVIEMIDELSTQKINGEFNAYYYIDENNEFVWKSRGKETDNVSVSEGVDAHKFKIKERVWEILNAVVVDCGKDPSGKTILTSYYDDDSAAEFGLKWANTIETKSEIASSLMAEAQALKTWVNNSDENKQNFPDSYPLTLPWESRNDGGIQSGVQAVAKDDASWVQVIRSEAKWLGVAWARMVVDRTGYIRPKVDVRMQGRVWERGAGETKTSAENVLNSSALPIIQGSYVKMIVPSYNDQFQTGVNMRCIDINHEIDRNGWTAFMRFELDIENIRDYNPNSR